MSDEQRECPKCGVSMIKRENYLPDDYDLTEIRKFWLCGSCMYYEPIE
jgi:ribosomal protein S27AE